MLGELGLSGVHKLHENALDWHAQKTTASSNPEVNIQIKLIITCLESIEDMKRPF